MKHIDLNLFSGDTAALKRTTVLFQEAGLRGLLLHLKTDEQIPEHQTRGPITVHCLKGEAAFLCGGVEVTLQPASLVSVPPAAPHSLTAREDTLLFVIIREQIRDEAL